jgi:hypothetical protein
LNEAALGGGYRVLGAIDIGDSKVAVSLAEWSVSSYDEAIVSLSPMVGSMKFDSKVGPQVLCFFNNFPTKVD